MKTKTLEEKVNILRNHRWIVNTAINDGDMTRILMVRDGQGINLTRAAGQTYCFTGKPFKF